MKTIKIGNIEVEIAENADDLGIRRFVALKEFMLYRDTGTDMPNLRKLTQGFIEMFNQDSKAGMLIALYDFQKGVNQIEAKEDSNQLIFSLMTFEKDEDRSVADKTKLKEKLTRFAEAGLTQKKVKEYAEDFIEASSAL